MSAFKFIEDKFNGEFELVVADSTRQCTLVLCSKGDDFPLLSLATALGWSPEGECAEVKADSLPGFIDIDCVTYPDAPPLGTVANPCVGTCKGTIIT